jgi:hypothetical protein
MRILLLLELGLTIGTGAFADDHAAAQKPAQSRQPKATNNICPVSGDKIGFAGKPVNVEYQGAIMARVST